MTTTPSWWDLDSTTVYDVIVVGAGIIGTQTAIELVTERPELRVLLVDRGLRPTGASTRNAGFVCFGSAGELYADMKVMGREGALNIVQQRIEGLHLLLQRTQGYDIGYEVNGGHELFLHDHDVLDVLDDLNDAMQRIRPGKTYERRDDLIPTFGFSPLVKSLVTIHGEGTLHSGKLMSALWHMAEDRGVRLRTGCTVTSVSVQGDGVTLHCSDGMSTTDLRCEHVVLATNAASVELEGIDVPGRTIEPARGQIVITEPREKQPLRGSYHYDDGFYYFRSLGSRILLGGGRNTDIEHERTHSFDTTSEILSVLRDALDQVIAPGENLAIEHSWAGTMGFSDDKQPHVDRLHERLTRAFGCNGMGVALGANIARATAASILKSA